MVSVKAQSTGRRFGAWLPIAAVVVSFAVGGVAAAIASQNSTGSDETVRSVPAKASVADSCKADLQGKPATVQAIDQTTQKIVTVKAQQWCEVLESAQAKAPADATAVMTVTNGELQVEYHATQHSETPADGGGIISEDHVKQDVVDRAPPVPIAP